jgi:UDP-glucose 4-epimerase
VSATPARRQATVIGGDGFIGRRLRARLHGEGWECWLPRRDDPGLWRRDLGRVFYCAGLTADFAERPFDTVEAHVSLLSRVLRDARFESLVYLSSTRLYDGLGDVDATEDLPLRLDPGSPRHLYDLSKALGESLCSVAGHGRARVARLSCVWGDAADAQGFLPALLQRVLASRAAPDGARRPRLLVESSPRLARDYVHIDDVVDALVALAARGEATIYNVAGGCNVGNAQLFELLAAASGCELVPAHDRPAPAAPRISIARMADEFGWRPADVLDRVGRVIERECACSSW